MNSKRIASFFQYISFVCVAMLAAKVVSQLIKYRQWGDESETIVAAKMLADGSILYKDIFNHHGPLTFLPSYLLELIGDFSVTEHRLIIITIQIAILAFLLIAKGDHKVNYSNRLLSVSFFLVSMWGYGPAFLANVYQYQTLTGLALFSIIYFFTLPVLQEKRRSRGCVIFNSALIFMLPLISITNAPVAICLLFSSIKKEQLLNITRGLLLGLVVSFIYLMLTTSVTGYFAYHIYLNSTILPMFNGGQSILQLFQSSLNGIYGSITNLLLFFIVCILLIVQSGGKVLRVMLILAGICSLLIRSEPLTFHAVPHFYITVAIIVYSINNIINLESKVWVVIRGSFVIVVILKFSQIIYYGEYDKNQLLKENKFSRLVKSLTDKDDKIIAHSFANYLYLISDRLPASGHFFYLPWQQKYEENPKYGISINVCKDIRLNQPKVIYADKWKVWGVFDWNDYAAQCYKDLLRNDYKLFDDNTYLRRDIYNKLIMKVEGGNYPEVNLKVDNYNSVGVNKNVIGILGDDPYITYTLMGVKGKSSLNKLYFELNTFGNDSVILKLYLAHSNNAFNERDSMVLSLKSGKYVIDFSHLINDEYLIDKIRLDIESEIDMLSIDRVTLLPSK